MVEYLKTILISTLIGAIAGALLCLFIAFTSWSSEILNQILTPVRICGTIGFILGNLVYFLTKSKS